MGLDDAVTATATATRKEAGIMEQSADTTVATATVTTDAKLTAERKKSTNDAS